ncbi:MAG: tetrahydrofolate dehydrogenase/cyclohydrolase catalytic domain-containing protein [Clostridiales bacterium]|uniref:bifunctional 5,10-methylenetetrahydrofolate dehydrogenase/5,10-methenyltetrahydrofolate cyclohydrolase n=2 Tax=Terrisporobacter sp. TaxID=1965305 RepID=UPI002A56149B|nr:tetrahydrofolate dehydrogenase/cyclohydrolase catalytic domain-containing protein [Terrisporobacter sp.]MDD7754306.1 tetrahydrofolate dehydrogenase/cyclohydrolase catalytic domain-containing protein [Clostridiales bacterium]MDY4134983.1 tetrahydrofolate dehydrogenase/cyclohydrolase catalytic domain-containing protein [Terrisporobacter sp.]
MKEGKIMTLLDARKLVSKKVDELKSRVDKLSKKPSLVIIRVGDDFASGKYVANKIKKCDEVGIDSKIIHFDGDVKQEVVEETILNLNKDEDITGILLQLPIPKHLDEDYLTNLIEDEKDVDGFTIGNMGKLSLGLESNVACTPRGIITLLKEFNIEIEGQDVLIINRSNIVGKPLAQLFLKENATVTIAHSKTKNLKEKIVLSDIVVTAVGKANFLRADDFKNNTTIIDVSINFNELGKMCGDVAKEDYDVLVNEKQCNLTPVPNGVGQMTVIELIEQTIEIAEKRERI